MKMEWLQDKDEEASTPFSDRDALCVCVWFCVHTHIHMHTLNMLFHLD